MQSATIVTVPGGGAGSKTSGGTATAKKTSPVKQQWCFRRKLGHSVSWREDGRFTLSFTADASPVNGYYGFEAAPQRSMADAMEIGRALQTRQQLLAIARQAVNAPCVKALGREVALWGFAYRDDTPNEILLKFHVRRGDDYYLKVVIDA